MEIETRVTHKVAVKALVLDSDVGFTAFFGDLEWPVLDVLLDIIIIHSATNQPLGVKHGIRRVRVESVFRAVSDTGGER